MRRPSLQILKGSKMTKIVAVITLRPKAWGRERLATRLAAHPLDSAHLPHSENVICATGRRHD